MWNINQRKKVFQFDLETGGGIRSLCFSVNGKSVFCGCDNGKVYELDILNNKVKNSIQAHKSSHILGIEASSDGKYLYTIGYSDHSLKQWDISNGLSNSQQPSHVFEKNGKYPRCLFLSSNGRFAFIGYSSENFKQWDLNEKKLFKDYGQVSEKHCYSGCITRSGKDIILGFQDGSSQHWIAES